MRRRSRRRFDSGHRLAPTGLGLPASHDDRRLAAPFAEDPPVPAIRDAGERSPLDDRTLRPVFACRTADGHRFVLR